MVENIFILHLCFHPRWRRSPGIHLRNLALAQLGDQSVFAKFAPEMNRTVGRMGMEPGTGKTLNVTKGQQALAMLGCETPWKHVLARNRFQGRKASSSQPWATCVKINQSHVVCVENKGP